jgi:hypothetical protein
MFKHKLLIFFNTIIETNRIREKSKRITAHPLFKKELNKILKTIEEYSY